MTTRLARAVLPWLLMLSGFCGISYEILYNRLLGNLLGNQFFISATVLLTFLLGIGFGTLYAHRFVRHLWLIEAGIGAYAALMALAYPWIGKLLYLWIPGLGGSIYLAALASFCLLAPPAFLIGCSVPLFAGYLSSIRPRGVFAVAYGVYNLGAALTALALEFALLRMFGLRLTTLWVAGLNGVVAVGVLWLSRQVPLIPETPSARIRYPARVLIALAVASIASAVFQLLLIKIAEFIYGPFNETFALVLATVLLGLALGSLAAGRFGLTFNGALLLSLAGLAWILTVLPGSITAYATLAPRVGESYPLQVALKLLMMFVLMGLPAVGFGATIPALIKTYKDVTRESGQLLFCSSVANAAGFMLMAFVLHQYLDYGPILLLVAALTLLALLVHAGRPRRAAIAALVLVGMATAGYAVAWDETVLYLGHTNFRSPAELREAKAGRIYTDRFKGPRDVFAIVWRDGVPLFFINGYISIPMAGENASERLVGALSSMFAPRLDQALVLGLGSGATAGTVGQLFDQTDVVEINGAVLDNLHLMSPYNFDIQNIPQVNIIHDDGIHFVRTTQQRYSLVLNTVTTPLYFSSSKLYTRDFFEAVRERMTPDGVYVTWVDLRIGDRGADIILASLAESFSSCWLSYMDADYFLLACSNDEMGLWQFESVAGNERLRDHFAGENFLPLRLLPYSVLSVDAMELRSTHPAPLNTLDYPALEFEMARIFGERPFLEFLRILHDRLDLPKIQNALSGWMAWDPAEFAFLRDLRLTGEYTLARTLRSMVPYQFELTEQQRDAATLDIAEEVGTAAAHFRFGEQLLARQRFDAASRLFAGALERNPAQRRANLYIGRCLAATGEHTSALDFFEAEWELSRDAEVPLAVAASLIELEDYDAALLWLDRAEQQGPESDAKQVAQSRNVAIERRRQAGLD